MEGDKYPTQNLILVAMYFIQNNTKIMKNELIKEKKQNDIFIGVVIDFETEIEKIYFKLPQETLIAACLDPR